MLGRLRTGLAKTRAVFRSRLDGVFADGRPREEILEALTESLILADAGVPVAERVVEAVRARTRKTDSAAVIGDALKTELKAILSPSPVSPVPEVRPSVLLLVGVNGGGKTTTAAKIALLRKTEGQKVLLVAGDTFRAAAEEQLALWGRRLGIPVHRGRAGADPASVVFDAVQMVKAREFDLMIVDTAGRIHTNASLMGELDKIRRILGREIEGAPHEVLLVLDAALGQNALLQAGEFVKSSGLTGIVLTKLDGTAKGGAVLAVAAAFGLPIRWIGTGEGAGDLEAFSAASFVDALMT